MNPLSPLSPYKLQGLDFKSLLNPGTRLQVLTKPRDSTSSPKPQSEGGLFNKDLGLRIHESLHFFLSTCPPDSGQVDRVDIVHLCRAL